MEKIKVGIIGYGLSGHIFHGAIINGMPGYDIKWVYTSKKKNIKLAKDEIENVNIAEDVSEIFEDVEVDLVVICAPNVHHFSLAKRAMEHRKHVVMEKPFTVTSSEAKTLIDLSKAYNVMLTVYHNRRYDGDFMTVKKVLQSDVLGEIVEYESHFDRFRPEFKEHAWREEDLPGSGILYDLGPHLMYQAVALFGRPKEVYADIRAQRGGPVDDAFEVVLYYPDLKVVLKAGALVNVKTPRFMLLGKKGSFIKYGLDVQEEQLKKGLRPGEKSYGKETVSRFGILNTIDGHEKIETEIGDYRLFYDMVYNHLMFDEYLEVTSSEGLLVIEMIEAAFKSMEEKRRIQV